MSVTLPNVEPSSVPVNSLNGAGILVVDEDPAFQLGLKTFLKEYVGFREVFVAKTGAEALQLLENEKSIEIVTLDYQMPGMNGIEVLRRLNAAPPHPLSVMMITGYPSDELEGEFRNLGTNDILTTHFLSKPVEFEDLESLVLESHTQLKEAKKLAAAIAEQEALKAAEAEAAARKAQIPKVSLPSNFDTDTVPISGTGSTMTGFRNDPSGPISPIAAAALLNQRDPTEPIPVIETSNPQLLLQLENLNNQVAELENEVKRTNDRSPSLQSRFWLDVLKIIFIATVAFILYQFGLIQKAVEFLDSKSGDRPDSIEEVSEPAAPVVSPAPVDKSPPLDSQPEPSTEPPSPEPDNATDPSATPEPESASVEPEPATPAVVTEPAPVEPNDL